VCGSAGHAATSLCSASRAALSALLGSTGSIVAGALLHATAGVASSTLAVAGAASVGGSLTVSGALSAASLTVGGASIGASAPSPPACVPPGATGLFYNGTSWVCACAARWSGASCTVPSAAPSLLAGGCTTSPCQFDSGAYPGQYYFVPGTGTSASLPTAVAVAVNPFSGNVYVTGSAFACHVSPLYHCVAMVTPTTGVVTQVDRTWTSPTQSFSPFTLSTSGFPFMDPSDSLFPYVAKASPLGLAFDSSGNLFVVDDYEGNGIAAVYKVSPAGEVTPLKLTWPATFTDSGWKRLYGIAIRGVTIYLTGSNYNTCVMKGTLVGTSVTLTVLAGAFGNNPGSSNGSSNTTFGQPKGIAVDSNGNVFVGDYTNNMLRMITPGGMVSTVFTQTVGGFKSNDGVAVDSSDNVYFATGSSLMKYSSAGAVSVVASSGFSELAGIAINTATGVIYAADKGGRGYVWKFV